MGVEQVVRQSVLREDTIYEAGDRFVCARSCCAGVTALATGYDIDGHLLRPVGEYDVREWASYDLGPLRCECGRLTAGEL